MSSEKNSLLKQLFGAVSGMAIALGIYGVYTLAAPPVKAFLSSVTTQTEETSKFTEGERRERRDEVAARAKEIIERELQSN